MASLPAVMSALWLASPATVIATTYKWIDTDGKVHYSDRMPDPAHLEAHQEIDASGTVVKEVDPSPQNDSESLHAAEVEAEREKQAQRDRNLLHTYNSVDEIIAARDQHLATIRMSITITEDSVSRLDAAQHNTQRLAADYERRGQAIPETLTEELKQINDQLRQKREYITRKLRELEETEQKYGGDIERFEALKNAP